MKAWRVNELGHPSESLNFEEIPDPTPGPGEIRVDVEAVTVNFADILLCQGIYQDRPGVPLTPGLEAFGTVLSVGQDVKGIEPGQRVGGMCALPAGGYAEQALIRAPSANIFPDDMPAEAATVLYSTYQTSHVALHHRAHLQAGEWLLVHAGAGGVGSAAVQIGVAAGAKVIATAGSAEKLDVCRSIGAHHVIDYRTADIYAAVKEITGGGGVDVVYDPVGGAVAEPSRRLLNWEGRYLVIGFAGGEIPQFPGNHVLVKNYTVLGVHWGQYPNHDRSVVDLAHADLMRLYAEGQVAPVIADRVKLDEVPRALAALESRKVAGRVVVVR